MQTVCSLIYLTAKSLYMFRVSTAPIIRGPDLTTLDGSSCTGIMTCTGGCSYSF